MRISDRMSLSRLSKVVAFSHFLEGRCGEEADAMVLGAAHLFEVAQPWTHRRPEPLRISHTLDGLFAFCGLKPISSRGH
jgi:hypothetical protein